ncbi:MAG: PilZ domain-containing protein [Spirochaetota bacterium]
MRREETPRIGVQSKNKRKSGRVRVAFEATYDFANAKSICLVTDLSMTGASLKVQQFFTEGDVLTLIFKIPNMGDFSLTSKVRHVRGGKIGIEFLSLNDTDRQVLTAYVNRETSRVLTEFTQKKKSMRMPGE